MSKIICGYPPLPDPSFARRRTNATGPKIRRAQHAPAHGPFELEPVEILASVGAGAAIAAIIAGVVLFGVMAANNRVEQAERWSKLTGEYMAEKRR